MILFLILGLLLGAAAVIFALQNLTTITVTFLFWQINGSLALILLVAVATGVAMTLLFSLPSMIKTSWAFSKLQKHNKKLQQNLDTEISKPVVVVPNDPIPHEPTV